MTTPRKAIGSSQMGSVRAIGHHIIISPKTNCRSSFVCSVMQAPHILASSLCPSLLMRVLIAVAWLERPLPLVHQDLVSARGLHTRADQGSEHIPSLWEVVISACGA